MSKKITARSLCKPINGPRAADRAATAVQTKPKSDSQTATVTPVRGPRTLELVSGKAAGKVLIVDHMG